MFDTTLKNNDEICHEESTKYIAEGKFHEVQREILV
jgi:hypothetical protein